MISIEEAKLLIQQTVIPGGIQARDLAASLAYYLAEDVISPINMPPFRQAAMDGYAMNLHDKLSYSLVGEIKAGDNLNPILKSGEAVRIFTGAAVPDTANTIVIQENTTVGQGVISTPTNIRPNENIRPLGEQVQAGEVAMKKGSLLSPAAIGFLASLGITQVPVFEKPQIALIATGNELVAPGAPLPFGSIYESNAIMLESALKRLSYTQLNRYGVKDDYPATLALLVDTMATADVVLITGGISVGDYDFVGKALQALEVEEIFYLVNQKPGKPLYFGKKGSTLVFALPGNPAAALNCFYIYVNPALQKMSGAANYSETIVKASSKSNFTKKGGRPQFLKAIYENHTVTILEGQSSAMLHTFSLANALVFLDKDQNNIRLGENIDVILIPN